MRSAAEQDLVAIESLRLKLRAAEFPPVPLNGKIPTGKGWQRLGDATDHEIRRWSRSSPACTNTGVLTRRSPAFDIDILDPEAAQAVEDLVRQRFGGGRIMLRFGRAPKRAILFKADEPFEKVEAKLIAPDGSTGQKLEVLADGQQLVVDGIHPDTGQAYAWHGGVPGDVKRGELPAIDERTARALVEAAATLLVDRHGYRLVSQPKIRANKTANGAGQGDLMADWTIDFSDHDALAALTMKLLKSGMNDGAAVNFLRSGVSGLANVDEDRRARRLKEIPAMVASGRQKLDAEAPAPPPDSGSSSASWGDAEREIAARLAEGDSAGFLSRARADVGFPFEPEAIAALNQLARRRAPDFERLRTQLKAETKVRFAALEAAMKAEAAIGDSGDDGLPGRPITFEEIEPWAEPVDGEKMLTELSETIGAYVIMDKHQRDAAALWAAHAHAHDFRDTSPPLVIKSPAMRSGKTKLVEVLERLVPRPLFVSGITVSFLERAIEAHRPTLLIDEYDALTSNDPALAEAARAQLNRSAKRRGARVGKNVPLPGGGYESRLFSTWAPTVIAGIGDPPNTVRDRAVVIDLKRKLSSEKVKPLRERDGADLAILRRKLARFVADNEQRLRERRPRGAGRRQRSRQGHVGRRCSPSPMSRAGTGRRAPARRDWRWPWRRKSETAEADVKLVLLADIRDIFAAAFPPGHPAHEAAQEAAREGGRSDGPRMSSKRLLEELHGLEERPWSAWGRAKKPITGKSLGDLLRPYGVRSGTVRIDGEHGNFTTAKGYYLRSFDDAFARYLPTLGVSKRPHRHKPRKTRGKRGFRKRHKLRFVTDWKMPETPAIPGFVAVWRFKRGGIGGLGTLKDRMASKKTIRPSGISAHDGHERARTGALLWGQIQPPARRKRRPLPGRRGAAAGRHRHPRRGQARLPANPRRPRSRPIRS